MLFLLGCNFKIVIYWEELTFWGKEFLQVEAEGMSKFLVFSKSPPVRKTLNWKISAALSLQEADNFDFQLDFNLKYTKFVFKENNFFRMIYMHSLSILGKTITFS